MGLIEKDLVMIKLIHISGPIKCMPPQRPGPHPKPKPESAFSSGTRLSRKPNTYQSQSSHPALAGLLHPREQDITALQENPRPPSPSCPVSALPLLIFQKTPSCPKSLGNSAPMCVRHATAQFTGCLPLNKDTKLTTKLSQFCHLTVTTGLLDLISKNTFGQKTQVSTFILTTAPYTINSQ